MSNPGSAAMVEVSSPVGFASTIDRIVQAIGDAGLLLMARIDHSAGASTFGLQLAPTVVLLYGHPKGGTQIMREYPAAALELPLRVLVRECEPGATVVSFHPIVDALGRLGVPADLARPLERSQNILLDAVRD